MRCRQDMPIKEFTDLVVWQLANTLKCEVLDFISKPPACRDFEYCARMRDSTASTTRNISEGFSRRRRADFAKFLEYALASLMETEDGLIDAHNRGYIAAKLYSRLWNLSKAAERAIRNLHRLKRRQADEVRNKRKRGRMAASGSHT
jgi:four helix bundle protein